MPDMRRILFFTLVAGLAVAQQKPATTILIAYHSQSGNTEKFASAVRDGAASVAGVEVQLRKAGDVTDAEILKADGVVLGTPVHWANISAEAKRFQDHTGDVLWKAKTNGDGKTAGGFCTGGSIANGKEMARMAIISAFLAMRFVIVGGVDTNGFGTMGAQATTGPADPGLSEKELDEARKYGERFAKLTRQLRSGTQ
jgi:NAD(P)H dehydrogenase (quinone)